MDNKPKQIKADLSKRDERFHELSLNGNMWKVVFLVGAPLALYQMLSQIFAVLDTAMASHISSKSVSAVAYLNQINLLLSAIGSGLAIGAGIKISNAFGKGDFLLVKKRVSTIYLICALIGLALMCIIPFTGAFLRLLNTPESLIEVGREYFNVHLITLLVQFINNVYITVERARGNSRRIFTLNLAVIIVKLSLTAIFVYFLNGDLTMVAIATLISQLVLFVAALINSRDKDSAFGFSFKAVSFNKEVVNPMFNSGYPVVLEKALFAAGKTTVNSMCTIYGDLMVGAMGVSNNLGGFTTMPQNGFQDGVASVISQNMGGKKYDRVLKAFYCTLIICMTMGLVISSFELWQIDFMTSLFDSGNMEFHDLIKSVYRFEALGGVPLGINAAVLGLLYGLGKTKLTMVINVARIFVFRLPVLWFLQNFTSLGSKSAGVVMMISHISIGIMSSIVAVIVIRKFKQEYLGK